jgi:nucleoside phosphorylase
MIVIPELTTQPVTIPDEAFRCDVLLFVATTSEKEKLEETAKSLGLSFRRVQGAYFRYYDLGQVGTYPRVLAVRTEMGPFSRGGSAARALMAVAETRATAMISLGMAFGVDRRRQKHGDVIVSRSLLTYDNRKISSGFWSSRIDYSESKPFPAKESLLHAFSMMAERDEWKSRVSFGPILTGGAKIHCAKYRDHLVKHLSRDGDLVIGGEMEGAGLLAASDPAEPSWIVVKGISDFADKRRDREVKQWRRNACENAARFVLTALREFEPESER